MPRMANQKLKMIYLKQILEQNTDEEHAMTTSQLIDALAAKNISAERKSIYADIEALQNFGVDIVGRKTKSYEYYVANKKFELPELKLLADAVASSKFITAKKSRELIRKIESLASIHEAQQLQRQVFVTNRVKTLNECIYYNVDKIHLAIAEGNQISFSYFDIGVDKQKCYRDGLRTCSPYALSWDDENYYLVGFYEKYDKISHFRVDRMEKITVLNKKSVAKPADFDISQYSKQVFSMFCGELERVSLQLDNKLIGVVFDKFGKDVAVKKVDENSFEVTVEIAVSPSFYGWVFQFGALAKILSPAHLQKEFYELAKNAAGN